MIRTLFTFFLAMFFATNALASPPREAYTDEEYAEIMTAASYVGSLKFCENRGIYTSSAGRRLFYKVKAHVVPSMGKEGLAGEVAESATRILVYAVNNGRAALFGYDPAMVQFAMVEAFDMRSVEDCKKVSERAFKLMAPGKLFDNAAEVPDGDDS